MYEYNGISLLGKVAFICFEKCIFSIVSRFTCVVLFDQTLCNTLRLNNRMKHI